MKILDKSEKQDYKHPYNNKGKLGHIFNSALIKLKVMHFPQIFIHVNDPALKEYKRRGFGNDRKPLSSMKYYLHRILRQPCETA